MYGSIYVYVHKCSICKIEVNIILSRINRTTMNLLLKVSCFLHDVQVSALL